MYLRLILAIFFLGSFYTVGQVSSFRQKRIASSQQEFQFDTLSVYPSSFEIYCSDVKLDFSEYELDFARAVIKLKNTTCDSLLLSYRVFNFSLSKPFQRRNESMIFNGVENEREKFLIPQSYSVDDVFGGSEISKQGSISRGVSFGNNQDLGINSSLNLELSGQISPQLKILASISDANIPIQPDGTTNKLQEFDQLYIQIYNDNLKLIGGDFWLNRPEGYFLTYKKRAQGLTSSYQFKNNLGGTWKTQVSGALSKGKFNRQIISGIESNQGPYRLRGSENEPFIIILGGTERIYIDGRLLERGQEFDYTIDYNTSEVVFTSRNLITKDSRIVAEFQYSDQNYARSLVQSSTSFESKKMKFWFNAYSEQDAKNQSLQQKLDNQQKMYLSSIGDSLQLARISSIDSVGYFPNQIQYKLIDSLGFDSVLVFSINTDSAKYNAFFIQVGANQGDYVLDQQIALGKIYKWVAPVAGIPQGNFISARLIATPKKKQFISTGISYSLSKNSTLKTEFALSNEDKNTFSSIGNNDNLGFGGMFILENKFNLVKDSTQHLFYQNNVKCEIISQTFAPIEQFRSVEFDRDWNTRNMNYIGNQSIVQIENSLNKLNKGKVSLDFQNYTIGQDFRGNRLFSTCNWNEKGWKVIWDASYLNSKTKVNNEFIRHRAQISKQFKFLQVGFVDDHEFNVFKSSALDLRSYQFYDYQFFIATADSSRSKFKLSYRERYDWKPLSNVLKPAAKATTTAAEFQVRDRKNNILTFISGVRSLKILDSTLLNQQAENTLIGRIEYNAKFLKNVINFSSFYEVGSGLEQRKEFIYLKVNDGQGIYTWIDYDADGIEDLNEFEIAQFIDQASYIRVFIPSSTYSRTYSNELNGSVFIRPEKILQKKNGVLKKIGLFSDQLRVRVMKKVNSLEYNELFNPFYAEIRDSNLISTNSNIKNSLFFNRNSSVFGMEYNFQMLNSKTLLASGFDSRKNLSNELSMRWNMTKFFALNIKFEDGVKMSIIDYTINRNYEIKFQSYFSELIYQPNTNFRIGAVAQISMKRNSIEFGSEQGSNYQVSVNTKYNQSQKGSLISDFKTVFINYNGNINSAVGFEMMEGLKPGVNQIWSIGYQRLVSKNLQLSIQYSGRKSEQTRIIHTGGMELRALF
jgi:hypothetical protein